jgi:hypothetical protein
MVVLAMVYAPKVLPILSRGHLSPIQRHFAGTARKLNKPSLVLLQWARRESTRLSEVHRQPSPVLFEWARKWRTRLGAIEDDEGTVSSNDSNDTPEASSSSATRPTVSDKRARAKAVQERGQATAVVTGAVAVLLGVAYLVLVRLLDTRGVTLIPPPPEAFDP